MKEQIFHLRGVRKYYQDRCVLKVDDLDVHKGEILAIVGPSGAGKSTLLRLMNFLEKPTEGTVKYDKHIFSPQVDIPLTIRRQVTTVFQSPLLLNRNVWANVRYGLQLRGEKIADQRVEKVLAQVGLLVYADHKARTLSGGEAQRVALARAIVLEPKVLLLDEPTANLDPFNVSLIEENVQKLNRDSGTTIVMVTHNMAQAARISDYSMFMYLGELIEYGKTKDMFIKPIDKRTEEYLTGKFS
jgi:tungstate transport system ATP-binding protein